MFALLCLVKYNYGKYVMQKISTLDATTFFFISNWVNRGVVYTWMYNIIPEQLCSSGINKTFLRCSYMRTIDLTFVKSLLSHRPYSVWFIISLTRENTMIGILCVWANDASFFFFLFFFKLPKVSGQKKKKK